MGNNFSKTTFVPFLVYFNLIKIAKSKRNIPIRVISDTSIIPHDLILIARGRIVMTQIVAIMAIAPDIPFLQDDFCSIL